MNQELVDYIKQQMSLNVSKNKITDVLLGQGWQQAELDEAFNAAEGAAKAAASKVPFDDQGTDMEDDIAAEEGGGSKQKMILIGGVTLAIVAIIAGILIFSGGKEQPKVAEEPVKTDPVEEATTTVENVGEPGKSEVDNSAVLAAIQKLNNVITPPAGWVMKEGAIHDRPMVAYFKPEAEKDSTGKDILTENISITADTLKLANVASDGDYLAKSKNDLQTAFQNFKITAEKGVTLSDGKTKATLIGSSYAQNGNNLRGMQLFVFRGEEVYVVSGVVLASNWDAEKDILGEAVLSFRFPE